MNSALLVLALGGIACVQGDLPPLPGCTESAQSGSCMSFEADPQNCGALGHDCLGGSCNDGQCQPIVLASGQEQANNFLLDDGYLYWGAEATPGIKRLPITGGEVEILTALNVARPSTMVVDSNNVYWTVRGIDHSVRKMPKAGGKVTALAYNQHFPTGIAVDGTNVYWASYWAEYWPEPLPGHGQIQTVPIEGGTVVTLASGLSFPAYLTLGPGRIVWSEQAENFGSIKTLALTGEVELLATNQNRPHIPITDGTYVWWTVGEGGTVLRVPLAGGPTELLASARPSPAFLSRTGDRLFWIEGNTVQTMSIQGGEVTELFHGDGTFAGWAQDSTSYYWLEIETGLIKRLAKPL